MQNHNGSTLKTHRFEFPGSVAHYPPLLSFTLEHMLLKIKPDFDSNTLKDCEQKLRITTLKDINEIKLDIAEIDVYQVTSSTTTSSSSDIDTVLSFGILKKDDKLIIKLGQTLHKDKTIDLTIRYSAGYYSKDGVLGIYKPRSGFYFVSSTTTTADANSSIKQAWTQGEALESKYWFPCLEDPQVKFAREIQITVPENDYVVISNGELAHKEGNTWTWIEQNPTPAYLTSVVIGKFAQEQQEYHYEKNDHNKTNNNNNSIPLLYYWPKEIPKKDAMLTFANTPNMIRFFEQYFDIKYPYKKYSQVAVEEFELGGMENTNCTILTKYILHDEIAAIDYTRDIDVVSHELAHQWFGDLVTCRDWSNIWLNEGFATYCETLYWESIKGFDEFCYKVIKMADGYLEESRRLYKRPLVTRIYKHPDDLFDAHSYEKGGCVLHMLRKDIGENNFRKSINKYLDIYKNKSAETDDLCKIVEDVTAKSMRQFFDQWVYGSGHPIIDIEFSLEGHNKIKIKISQIQKQQQQQQEGGEEKQDGNDDDDSSSNIDSSHSKYGYHGIPFDFNLDIKIAFFSSAGINDELIENVVISKIITEHTIGGIPEDAKMEWISIDPQFKILKEIKSIKITNETQEFQLVNMLKNQLRKGKTIIERIEAARSFKNYYSEDVINELQNAIVADPFYGVSIEAANTLGSYYEKNNYAKSNKAYSALVSCLEKNNNKEQIFSRLHPKIKQAIVKNIGQFEREESIDLLEPLLYHHQQNDETTSYFVRASIATAIGKSSKNGRLSLSIDNIQKMKIVSQLKEIVKTSQSFRNVIATGAIEGLKELSKDKDKDIVVDIANFLIENTNSKNDYFKRLAATSALSKFLRTIKDDGGSGAGGDNDEKEGNAKLQEMNQKVFDQLLGLLKDKRRLVKMNACKAFADNESKPTRPDVKLFKSLEELIFVAEHDLDGFIRREAERSANIIREWINEWSSKPSTLLIKLREE
jgi:aminopeptidase N